jgi:hypothetical protein
MRMSLSVLPFILAVLIAAPRVSAQSTHAAPQAALDAALQQHVAASAADRAAVLRLLDRAEVKAAAGQAGIDLRDVSAAVATLDAEQLAVVSAQAQQVSDALAGGQSRVTISTTAIIIGLLVLIVLILALD